MPTTIGSHAAHLGQIPQPAVRTATCSSGFRWVRWCPEIPIAGSTITRHLSRKRRDPGNCLDVLSLAGTGERLLTAALAPTGGQTAACIRVSLVEQDNKPGDRRSALQRWSPTLRQSARRLGDQRIGTLQPCQWMCAARLKKVWDRADIGAVERSNQWVMNAKQSSVRQ